MRDEVLVKLEGIDELARVMKALPEKIRKKAVRAALRPAGQVIAQAAKRNAPVLSLPTPTRTPGTVKRRISVRASKFARQDGDEGVFIGVRPIRGAAQVKRFGKAGANNPNDPFYWRFLEFGTKKMAKRPVLGPAAKSEGTAAIRKFLESAVPAIEKLNKKGA